MSNGNYRPPYGSNQSYPNYAGQPPGAYPPQYAQQPPYPGYPPTQPQQPPPGYYGQPPQPQHAPPPYGQHGQYVPAAPNPNVRGIEFPSYSATPHAAPPFKYPPPSGPPDAAGGPSAPPPPGAPPAPPGAPPNMYWPRQPGMPMQPRPFSEVEARDAASITFDRFDVDRGGYLDLQEFMDALRALHLGITYHEAMECFIRCDANEDGRIGKEEFISVYIEEMKKLG